MCMQCFLLQLNVGNVQDLLSSAIKDDAPVADIFYAYFALKNLGLKGLFILSSKNNCTYLNLSLT